MVRNIIEARSLVQNILNSKVLDPYPGTRKGVHFLDESEELNLDRANTFPKGYITTSNREIIKSTIGKTGHSVNSGNIDIWYFAKQDTYYTDGIGSYKNTDYINYMIGSIHKVLEENINLGSGYHLKSFGISEGPKKQEAGSFPVWYDVVPITIYWDRVY